MKKVIMLMFIFLSTSIFAAEWYSKAERPQNSSKDTLWYTYAVSTSGWIINQPLERATYYKMDNFNVEYPLYIHAVNAGFVDEGYGYIYKIYAKDGVTVLWESPTLTSIDGINVEYLATPLLLADDFWFSVTPTTGGYPRQFVEGWDNPTHSYVSDGSGGWINQIENINDEDQYMENFYDVLLSTYFDDPPVDVFPPSLRSITGTECFMDRDMDLSIVVQDMNPVISPMQSQYSLDGGSSWNDFNMSVSKTNYTFTGTLPAQVDGTAGFVKFYMEDSLGNATWSDDKEISWSKDLPMFEEDFENETFPPEGWSLNTTGAGWIESDLYSGGYVHEGRYAAAHMDDSGPNDDWLVTPMISIPATNSTTLTFWQLGDYVNYVTTGYHEVAVSTDMTTWDVIYTGHPDGGDTGIGRVWELMSLPLNAYVGQDIYIGFHYMGDYEDVWTIDDIEVFYDNEGPVITDIIGNPALDPVIGAYVNNDLDITMNVNDRSGIQSITGHYSYDSGTSWTAIPFSASKGDETWIATIPDEASPISGIINFDMVDLGGVATPTTIDYDFEFAPDNDPVVFYYVSGTEEFIGEPMDLTIVFYDESAIDTCRASYSKDGWVTQYDFEMTPAKVHEYTYIGTIPAETEQVLDGEVKFTIIDSEGNELNSATYTVKWYDGQLEFEDDFESGNSKWTLTGNWGIVEEGEFHSTSHALTESPGGDYLSDEITTATLAVPLDLSSSFGADMSFWCKYEIEAGFDYMYLDVTIDNGASWSTLTFWDGEGVDWHEENFNLDPYIMYSGFNLRFRWVSDGGLEMNGMYIDDIKIDSYHSPQPTGPLIDHSPYAPKFYEGSQNYNSFVDAYDISGVASVEVIYSIDSLEQDNIIATYVSDNQWEFAFPVQQPGKIIDYSFWAVDNDGYETYQDITYRIIAGRQNIYDSGIVSYYNTTENGDAKAVKVSSLYGERLASLLIRNYADPTHLSDDMTIRVWTDDGGIPGVEIIAPKDVTPEANTLENTSAMTLVDLREYSLIVSGMDFWIGFSSDYGIVYATQEDAVGEGVTAYNRSYDGIYNGNGTWTWNQYSGTNYHFRAVTGFTIGIEEQKIPTTTSLEQNYPNPFNPNTTINFSVAQDNSQIKLIVYNVNGQIVNTLVDGIKNVGKYAVNFDASTLNSGVYYYSLEVNGVKEDTKKMIMIK
ncbi:MAG: choice-of-anchor J domain-containing protein [Candidatus Delongbacteria bacterium]|jgi:hypothetical protein|nr:choice-of-anchor J domain-containing protein [Candidatus Delongbacteria bacterium]